MNVKGWGKGGKWGEFLGLMKSREITWLIKWSQHWNPVSQHGTCGQSYFKQKKNSLRFEVAKKNLKGYLSQKLVFKKSSDLTKNSANNGIKGPVGIVNMISMYHFIPLEWSHI